MAAPARIADFGAHTAPKSYDRVRDRRGVGIAGTLTALSATGEPVLVVCADARARRKALQGRLGGFAITTYAALARNPAITRPYPHLVALDPPAEPHHEALLHDGLPGRMTHLAWGDQELAYAQHVHERDLDLRASLRGIYAALRDRGTVALDDFPPVLAGRALRVLADLSLVAIEGRQVHVPRPNGQVQLEASASFVAYERRLEEGRRWLSRGTRVAA
jgi:single-stranded-DNA-specific exonuclease